MNQYALPILCIGGLDPSGGAGLLADARACQAFSCHALGVATAIVPQNSCGVTLIDGVAPEIVAAQIRALLHDIEPAAIKIGMIPGMAAAEVLVQWLRPLQGRIPIVIDPVFAPSYGPGFCGPDTVDFLRSRLLPLADLLTPNLNEARLLCGAEPRDMESMAAACVALREQTQSPNILLKGGHMEAVDGAREYATDLFFDGSKFTELTAPRQHGYLIRGTGCMLASAIAAQLANGKEMLFAAREGKQWLTQQISGAQVLGHGQRVAGHRTV